VTTFETTVHTTHEEHSEEMLLFCTFGMDRNDQIKSLSSYNDCMEDKSFKSEICIFAVFLRHVVNTVCAFNKVNLTADIFSPFFAKCCVLIISVPQCVSKRGGVIKRKYSVVAKKIYRASFSFSEVLQSQGVYFEGSSQQVKGSLGSAIRSALTPNRPAMPFSKRKKIF